MVLAFIGKNKPEKYSLIKPITLMNYCLQTMSFQPKNKIKHPHPKTNIHTHPKITRKTIKEKKNSNKEMKEGYAFTKNSVKLL